MIFKWNVFNVQGTGGILSKMSSIRIEPDVVERPKVDQPLTPRPDWPRQREKMEQSPKPEGIWLPEGELETIEKQLLDHTHNSELM